MYSWLWRHIPFKQWQLKALVSAVLAVAVGALLWYEVFPAVEPLLPFDDVQVETNDPGADSNVENPSPQPPVSSGRAAHSPAPAATSKGPQVVLPS